MWFFTFWLVLTVMYVCHLTELKKSLTHNSVTSWFVLRAWKQRTAHWRTPQHGIQWTVILLTLVDPLDIYASAICKHQCFALHSKSYVLCQKHKYSSTWLLFFWVASFGSDIYSSRFPPPLWQNKAADSLVTLCKYIYFFSIYLYILSIELVYIAYIYFW